MNLEKVFYIIISLILLTVFILFTFVFSNRDFGPSENSSIKTIYFVDNISKAHQAVIDLFNERNKGMIKVETINLSFEKFSTNERKELLARYLRSKNNRIDVFAVDQIWVPRFAKWGITLDKLIDSSHIKNILDNALETCYYKDSLVAVPLYIDIALMFYRDDLLKKFPDYEKVKSELQNSISWERLIELHKNLKIDPFYIFQADDYEGLLCQFTELMANQNSPIVDKSRKLVVNSIEGKKSLSLLTDLVNKYKISPPDVTYLKENESFRLFVKNNGLLVRGWSSMYDDEIENLTEEVKEDIKLAPTPHFEGTNPAAVYGGWNLMVSKFSERIPEVIKFAKFLISEEAQKIMFEQGGYLPINKLLYSDSSFVAQNPEVKYFEGLFKNGIHRPFLESYTSISDILSYYINRAIKQEISVNDALTTADKKITEKSILFN
jgi:multiple sugar transport system substrate-binding protein